MDLLFWAGVILFWIGVALMIFAPHGTRAHRDGPWVLAAAMVALALFLTIDAIQRVIG